MQGYLQSKSLKNFNSLTTEHQRFVLNWVNSYKITKKLTITEIPERFRTGVFPLDLLQCSDPSFLRQNSIEKPKSKDQCFKNLSILSNYMSSKGFMHADSLVQGLYQGKSAQVWEALDFIFSIHLKMLKSDKKSVFSWVNSKISLNLTDSSLVTSLKTGTNLLILLDDYLPEPLSNEASDCFTCVSQLQDSLNLLDVPFFYSSCEDYLNNSNQDYFYIQLHSIYKFCVTEDDKKKKVLSTQTSSKGSNQKLDYSFSNDSPLNLDSMEKRVANEERKLMFISDLRKIAENFKMVSVPSVREIPHSSSMPVLSQKEILICFLLTPRIVQIQQKGKIFRVIINLLPNESKFSLKNEKYYLECKTIGSMNSVLLCEIEEIQQVIANPPDLTLLVYGKPIKIICKSTEECLKYQSGLEYLLQIS